MTRSEGTDGLEVRRCADPAADAASLIADLLQIAILTRGAASVALSGGASPVPMLDALALTSLDWSRINVWQVDERVAPDGHPDRNAAALRARLLTPAAVPEGNVHLVPVTGRSPETAAAAYALDLQALTGRGPVLDVVHLGLGEDGHTASLFPGDPVLDVTDVDVAATGVHQGRRRITMTFPLLNRAAHRVWLVPGAGKQDAIEALHRGDRDVPAGRIGRAGSTVFLHA